MTLRCLAETTEPRIMPQGLTSSSTSPTLLPRGLTSKLLALSAITLVLWTLDGVAWKGSGGMAGHSWQGAVVLAQDASDLPEVPSEATKESSSSSSEGGDRPTPTDGEPATDKPATEPGSESATKLATERPTLAIGSQGPLVVELQTLLKQKGHYTGEPDGDFSAGTEEAVKKFQTAAKMEATGIVGPATWENLLAPASQPDPKPKAPAKAAAKPSRWAIAKPMLILAGACLGLGGGSYGLWLSLKGRRPGSSKRRPDADGPDLSPSGTVTQIVDAPVNHSAEIASNPEASNPGGSNSTPQGYPSLPSKVEPQRGGHLSLVPPPPPPPSGGSGVYRNGSGEPTRLPRLDVIETLIGELQSPEPAKRRKAIWELGQRGDSRAIQPLVNLMMGSDSKQRSLILAALSEIGMQTLKPMKRALAMSLQDENAEVRKNAIRDLTKIYEMVGQISQLLNVAAEDSDTEVRETARWALNQLNRVRTPNMVLEQPDPTLPNVSSSASTAFFQQSLSPPENLGTEELHFPHFQNQRETEMN